MVIISFVIWKVTDVLSVGWLCVDCLCHTHLYLNLHCYFYLSAWFIRFLKQHMDSLSYFLFDHVYRRQCHLHKCGLLTMRIVTCMEAAKSITSSADLKGQSNKSVHAKNNLIYMLKSITTMKKAFRLHGVVSLILDEASFLNADIMQIFASVPVSRELAAGHILPYTIVYWGCHQFFCFCQQGLPARDHTESC